MSAADQFKKILVEHGTIHNYHCFIGTSSDNGKTLGWHVKWACHASLTYVSKHNATHLYSSLFVDHVDHKPQAQEFWSYILDPTKSPFRSVLKDVEIIRDDTGYPIAFSINPDNDAQVIGSLCIATRIPEEHSAVLLSWKQWLDAGFDEHEAMCLANMITTVGKEPQLTPARGHYPFFCNLSLKKLRDGAPSGGHGKSLSKGGSYSPNNFLWTNADEYWVHPLANKVKAKGGYSGAFPAYYRYMEGDGDITCKPFPELVSFFKENRGSI
jgi:hypothetical protein